jgi:hypothetical protein
MVNKIELVDFYVGFSGGAALLINVDGEIRSLLIDSQKMKEIAAWVDANRRLSEIKIEKDDSERP